MKWFCAILLLLMPLAAGANDRHGVPRASRLHASAQQHDGSSPFPPPAADDTLFIVDNGGDLDTDCTFRSGGPLVIHLPVTRYVGPVSGNGTLENSTQLVANGYLSETAHLRMPAYDVDILGDPSNASAPPEVDRVYFNGHEIGALTGDNDIWKLNEFEVPIEWVKFPSIGSDGTLPVPADNTIVIYIDTESVGDENWCTSVDWVELDFGAIAPIFLVHGILSNPGDAWPDFRSTLSAAGIPFSDDISLSATGSIEGNAAILSTRLAALAAKFGAKNCHVVAHSKGGLDMRGYLDGEYDGVDLKVLSLHTLSTPHHGTVLADIAIGLTVAILGGDETRLILQQYPFGADLSVISMAVFNLRHGSVPGGIRVYSYGADADRNGNGTLDAEEATELPVPLGVSKLCFNIIRNEVPVKVTYGTETVQLWGSVSFSLIDIDVSRNFTNNDVFVSTNSAAAPFGTYAGTTIGANHSTIKSTVMARDILSKIVADYPNR